MGVHHTQEQGRRSPRTLVPGSPGLGNRVRHGRAVNTVAAYLRTHLRVPSIYLQPRLRKGTALIDILAIDAAGSGDVHAVEAKIPNNFVTSLTNLRAYMQALKDFPSHYKWIVLPHTPATERLAYHPSLFAANGFGRVGVFLLDEGQTPNELPQITAAVKAERFRVPAGELAPIEKFMSTHAPDIETRI